MRKNSIVKVINGTKPRSAWDKGVKEYALMILEDVDVEELPDNPREVKDVLLNGAESWEQYSYGGCALVYDWDIAKTLCTPSEFKRKRGGELPPNRCDTWLDVQTRALKHASGLIQRTIRANR